MAERAGKQEVHVYFETERAIVRQYRASDINALSQIMSDSRVHIYTKDKGNPWDKLRTEKYVRFMMEKDFKTLDCFHGAVVDKATNQLIGLCGLNPYKEDEPEIEFKLGVSYWGKGYATELGRQMIQEAFVSTDILGIYGIAELKNTASRKVLEKIGMEYLGNQLFRGQEDAFYYVCRPHMI